MCKEAGASPYQDPQETIQASLIDQDVLNIDSQPQDSSEGDASVLIAEQEADPSLASCWRQAAEGKSSFLIHKGILYHRDQVEGESVCQLCVPQTRRAPVEDYLADLRSKIEEAAQFATDHTTKAQTGYVSRYNLRQAVL